MSSDALAAAAGAIRAAGLLDGPDVGLNEALATVGLVDHHVHGTVHEPVDAARLSDMLIESDRRSAAVAAGSDTQVWYALRRWCAPLLGLPAHIPPDAYLAARLAMGQDAVVARLLPFAGFSALVVETGFRGDLISSPAELAAAAGVPRHRAHRVPRLEAIAERIIDGLADGGGTTTSATTSAGTPDVPGTRDAADWPDIFRTALAAELTGPDAAVGWKTILAYRGGFDRDLSRPADEAVSAAAVRWAAEVRAGVVPRLTDDTLLRFGLWAAMDTGRALQVHTGFGDPDLDLHRSDPLLLTDFIRATEERAPVLLLHTYPFHRGAGYLAQMFPHVYLDVGEAINYTGAASTDVVRESMELAPFRKVLFSSDAWGAPELHLLGSWLFRRAMSRILGGWVVAGDWSRADAERVIRLVAEENALRAYGLPGD